MKKLPGGHRRRCFEEIGNLVELEVNLVSPFYLLETPISTKSHEKMSGCQG